VALGRSRRRGTLLTIEAPAIATDLPLGASVAVNGVCLTSSRDDRSSRFKRGRDARRQQSRRTQKRRTESISNAPSSSAIGSAAISCKGTSMASPYR